MMNEKERGDYFNELINEIDYELSLLEMIRYAALAVEQRNEKAARHYIEYAHNIIDEQSGAVSQASRNLLSLVEQIFNNNCEVGDEVIVGLEQMPDPAKELDEDEKQAKMLQDAYLIVRAPDFYNMALKTKEEINDETQVQEN